MWKVSLFLSSILNSACCDTSCFLGYTSLGFSAQICYLSFLAFRIDLQGYTSDQVFLFLTVIVLGYFPEEKVLEISLLHLLKTVSEELNVCDCGVNSVKESKEFSSVFIRADTGAGMIRFSSLVHTYYQGP